MSQPSVFVSLAAGSLFTLGAATADTLCPPSPAAGATIDGNLKVVSAVDACYLEEVRIGNDITVDKDAALVAEWSSIGGNLKVRDRGSLELTDSTVGNDVQTTRAVLVLISGSTIGNNLKMSKTNGVDAMSIIGNTIGNDAGIEENVTGGLTISDNTVENNLACDKNEPAPYGIENAAKRLKDQCAGLGN